MLLASLLITPLIGALAISAMEDKTQAQVENLKKHALLRSSLVFLLSTVVWGLFDSNIPGYQLTASIPLIPGSTNSYNFNLGIDGLGLAYAILTTFTFPLAFLASWESIKHNVKLFLVLFLVLESMTLGVFLVTDLLLFYVFFEATLPPMLIIIGVFGASQNRVRASFLFFLYTLFGSLFMLLAIAALSYLVGSTDFEVLTLSEISYNTQLWLWPAIFLSLAIKTPLVPGHIRLSRAHVEAPVGGSMLLAGLMLKLGTYGYLRLLIPVLPEATVFFGPFVQTVAVISLVYASLTCIRQHDFKILVAYSSVAHMAVTVAALFSNTIEGVEGGILLSIAHGFVSPLMFYLVGGVLYDRGHTRVIKYFSGLITRMPLFALFLLLTSLANAGTPLSVNWVGEFMSLLGSVERSPVVGFILCSGIITSAIYSIWLYNRLCGGKWSQYITHWEDLSRREFLVSFPFLLATVAFGIFPNVILSELHWISSIVQYS